MSQAQRATRVGGTLLDTDLAATLPGGFPTDSPLHDPLCLLRVLHAVCADVRYIVPAVRPRHASAVAAVLGLTAPLPLLAWRGASQGAATDGMALPAAMEFVNAKLTAKLHRQLQDPVTLCR